MAAAVDHGKGTGENGRKSTGLRPKCQQDYFVARCLVVSWLNTWYDTLKEQRQPLKRRGAGGEGSAHQRLKQASRWATVPPTITTGDGMGWNGLARDGTGRDGRGRQETGQDSTNVRITAVTNNSTVCVCCTPVETATKHKASLPTLRKNLRRRHVFAPTSSLRSPHTHTLNTQPKPATQKTYTTTVGTPGFT